MNSLTLVVDGNHFMHTTLHAAGFYSENNECFSKENTKDEMRKDSNIFLEKLSQIFAKDIKNMNNLINNVIWVIDDSQPWRKDHHMTRDYLGLPKKLEYKGTRKKKKELDWNKIYEVFNAFVVGLKKTSNIEIKTMPGCEADDLVFAISSYYNSKGKNVLIYSGDNDLKQCANFNKSTNSFTMIYQKQQKKVHVSKDTGLFLRENSNSFLVDSVKSFVNNASSKMVLVDPFEVVFDKVIMGDDGDNIFPIMSEIKVYSEKSKTKAGQEYESKLSPTVLKKIKEDIDFNRYTFEDLYSENLINKLANSALRYYKTKRKFKTEDVINNIKLNITLVLLHKQSIPSSLYNNMFEWAEKVFNTNKSNVGKLRSYSNILKNIDKYDKLASDNTQSAGIFKQLGL